MSIGSNYTSSFLTEGKINGMDATTLNIQWVGGYTENDTLYVVNAYSVKIRRQFFSR